MEEFSEDSIEVKKMKLAFSPSKEEKMGLEEITFSSTVGRKLPEPRRFNHTLVSTTKAELSPRSRSQSPNREGVPNINKLLQTLAVDRIEQEKRKKEEEDIQFSIQEDQQKIIRSLEEKGQQYEKDIQEINDFWQKKVGEVETDFQRLLAEKEKEIIHLQQQFQLINQQNSQKVKNILDQQLQQLDAQEKIYREKLKEEKEKQDKITQELHQALELEKKNHQITHKVEMEMKGELLEKKFIKKLQKFERKVEEVVKTYHDKELVSTGSIQELRRELVQVKALMEVKEKQFYEELTLKDKKILAMEHSMGEISDLIYTAKTWKTLASDLANIIIHTCATVEDLPNELWTSTAPGLFTSVYDEFHGIKERPRSEATYLKKKQDFVIIQRLLLSKCLKFGKVI